MNILGFNPRLLPVRPATYRDRTLLDLTRQTPLAAFSGDSRENCATPQESHLNAKLGRTREVPMDQIDINKIWQNFVDTITHHYTDTSGRIGRAQFWYYVLVYAVVGFGVAVVGMVAGMGALLSAAYAVALLLPSAGMAARRIQDTGRSGVLGWLWAIPVAARVLSALFWAFAIMTFGFGLILAPLMGLVWLVALVAVIALIYFCVQPGEAGSNAHGPPPPVWTPGGTPRPTAPAA
jgi:uncharacterized membrane protein YhaH (DUF805 family)